MHNMKKYIKCMAFCLITSMSAMAQQTSLTIDNQSPGWLSSKIGYEDQQTVEELKVSGYINGTDINFLVQLQKEQKLRALDLSDVNILKGGEKVFISTHNNGYGDYNIEFEIREDNYFYEQLFLPFRNLQKLITPKALKPNPKYPVCVNADTVILNCQSNKIGIYPKFTPGSKSGLPSYTINVLEIAEGIDSIALSEAWNYMRIVLPSTITKLASLNISGGNIVSRIEHPEQIVFNNFSKLEGDTIFIPQGTTDLYKSSRFKKMKVFVEMNVPTSLHIIQPRLKLYRGDVETLLTTTVPEEVYYKELKWECSDENIAIVNQNGEVTAIAPGTAVITVSSVENPEAKTQCEVTVCDHTTGIEMASTEERVNVGGTIALVANTLPLETSDNEVAWSSNDEEIATVDDTGRVTGIKRGICTIKATSVDGGYVAECNITVVQPATGISVNKQSASILVGASETLTATVTPNDVTDKTVLWTSSDTIVAVVSADGVVTARKAGKASITATAVSNPEVKAICEVTVVQPVEGITLDMTSIIMEEFGNMVKLNATILPEDASDKSVRWSSSNPNVCTVTQSGTVVAVGNGTATVIATTVDGDIPATCVVNVKDYIYDVNRDGTIDVADIAVIIDKMAGKARVQKKTEE